MRKKNVLSKCLLAAVTALAVLGMIACSGTSQEAAAADAAAEYLTAEASGPGGDYAGPETWIEFPADGDILPMGEVTFTVYSAGQGIGGIDLILNGAPLPPAAVTDLGGSLVRVDSQWLPPEEGEYTLEARAGGGAGSSIRFCIVGCSPEEIAALQATATPDATTETGTPTAAGGLTPTITAAAGLPVNISFWAAPPYTNAGQCTTLQWDVTGSVQQVLLDGAPVNTKGSKQVCPCANITHMLQVKKSDGTSENKPLGITVSGSCTAATTKAPPSPVPATRTPTATLTMAPPDDTSGPSINSQWLVWESCKFYGQADISDPSGVSWAKFYFNKNGEGWLSVWMSNIGGSTWEAEAGIAVDSGIGTPIGSVEYYVQASDNSGNVSESGSSATNYTSCDG